MNRIVKAPRLESRVGDFATTAGSLGVRRFSEDLGRHSRSNRCRNEGAGRQQYNVDQSQQNRFTQTELILPAQLSFGAVRPRPALRRSWC
jgi:hypothetical protein